MEQVCRVPQAGRNVSQTQRGAAAEPRGLERDSTDGVSGTGGPGAAGPGAGCGPAASPVAVPRISSHRGCGDPPGAPGPRGASRWRERPAGPRAFPSQGLTCGRAAGSGGSGPVQPRRGRPATPPKQQRPHNGESRGLAYARPPRVAEGGSSRGGAAGPARAHLAAPPSRARRPRARRQRRPPHLGSSLRTARTAPAPRQSASAVPRTGQSPRGLAAPAPPFPRHWPMAAPPARSPAPHVPRPRAGPAAPAPGPRQRKGTAAHSAQCKTIF